MNMQAMNRKNGLGAVGQASSLAGAVYGAYVSAPNLEVAPVSRKDA